jgi:hypothetical protein
MIASSGCAAQSNGTAYRGHVAWCGAPHAWPIARVPPDWEAADGELKAGGPDTSAGPTDPDGVGIVVRDPIGNRRHAHGRRAN